MRRSSHAWPNVAARVLALALTVTLTASCGLLGSKDHPAASGQLPVLRVATMPLVDLAPLHLGIEDKTFAAEGVDVRLEPAGSGQAGLAKLLAGEVDIAYSGDVPVVLAQSKNPALGLRIVATASSASPHSTAVMVRDKSSIKSLSDLEGKRIAINGRGGVSDTLTMAVMDEHHVAYDSVRWMEMGFPNMAGALSHGDVDGAFLTEPFVTSAAKQGAIAIADPASGATENFPISCYATTAAKAGSNAAAITAFQRGLRRASEKARTDRRSIERMVISHAQVDQDTAALLAMPAFGSVPSATEMQRVPDLLYKFHVLQEKFTIAPLILPQPS
ncbi:ABC transporter substrate-binding protein [Amycolatopsis sp. NPDC059021]|uniref:ABC transporter substrate-binding protein n=1 Tax=Amycolatopsis sp. NPDC059021 TaxID=3346704 RepID=UPI0036709289